jgi:hypothetical protein
LTAIGLRRTIGAFDIGADDWHRDHLSPPDPGRVQKIFGKSAGLLAGRPGPSDALEGPRRLEGGAESASQGRSGIGETMRGATARIDMS